MAARWSFIKSKKICHFSDVTYGNIVDKRIGVNTDFSKLTLVLNRLNYGGGSNIFDYEVVFGNTNQYYV